VSDRLLRSGAAAAVLLVAFIAAVISFVHIEHLAVTHGQTAMAAALLPLSIDGTVTASSLVLLRAARARISAPALAQVMLGLSVLATLAANVAYGAAYGVTGALISGWPAVAFIGCAEMAITMARRARQPEIPADPQEFPVPVPVPLPTHRQVREEYACGPATAKKIRAGMVAAVKATSNGHAPEGR
jgi:Protein of unknown function (DUF2637)